MKLNILSLKGIEWEGEAASFNVKTTSGEITILNHHRPLITVLAKGTAVITDAKGNKSKINIGAGFLEMSRSNILNVLID